MNKMMQRLGALALAVMMVFGTGTVVSAAEEKAYTVTIATSQVFKAGTDDDVYIQFAGDQGTTSKHLLDLKGNDFEALSTQTYTVYDDADIGEVQSIILSIEGNTIDGEWRVDYLEYHDNRYDLGLWMHNSSVTIPLNRIYGDSRSYSVEIATDSFGDFGTDGDVYIKFIGDKGETSNILLDNPDYNNFMPGFTDCFDVRANDVGTVQKMIITYPTNSGWHLLTVLLDNQTYTIDQKIKKSIVTIDTATGTFSVSNYSGSVFSASSVILISAGGAALIALAVVLIYLKHKKDTKII